MANTPLKYAGALRGLLRTKTLWFSLLIGVAAAWAFALVLQPLPRTVTKVTDSMTCPALSVDHCLGALVDFNNSEIKVWDISSGRILRVLYLPRGICGPNPSGAFSADTRTFALFANEGITLWDVATGQVKETHARSEWKGKFSSRELVFDPNGRLVLALQRDSNLELWDVAQEQVFKTIPLPENDNWFKVGSFGDGLYGFLAVWEDGRNMKIWDLSTGQVRVQLANRPPFKMGFLTADNKTLLVSEKDGACKIVDIATASEREVAGLHGLPICDMSSDGKLVMWVEDSSDDGGIAITKWFRELLYGKNQQPPAITHIMELATQREVDRLSGYGGFFARNQSMVIIEMAPAALAAFDLPLPSRWPRIVGYASLVALIPLSLGLFLSWRAKRKASARPFGTMHLTMTKDGLPVLRESVKT